MSGRDVPDALLYGLPVHVDCPFCGRHDGTELHSPFGPQLSVATYWCTRCHTAFDFVKWTGRGDGHATGADEPRQDP